MKRYVEGIGYIQVVPVNLAELPRTAVYFGCDDELAYYVEGCSDTVYAVEL